MTNILFAASESVPFIKTGGLADVVGALPKCFDKEHFDVRVILPKYACMKHEFKNALKYRTHFYMSLAWRSQYVGILEYVLDGITYYFVDNEYYFSSGAPYGEGKWDIEKFAFFSRAVLSALPSLDWRPDIIHCHDWQSALIPVYLNDGFQNDPFYHGIKTVMTVHNLKFQGVWGKEILGDIAGLSDYYFTSDKLEAYGGVNLLKGGIVYADRITTVSESYAREIQTPFFGEGLDGLMRARNNVLSGIVNGIDYSVFSPENDTHIIRYTRENIPDGKRENKLELQKMLGLKQDGDVMLIGIVSRLTDQKGFDLVACVLEEFLSCDAVQLVVLGTGEWRYEEMFKNAAARFPGRVSACICYSDELAHKIYASSDAFLMPSLFEPCGLSQLIALKYGTLPIVRETGGLKDTVKPYNEFENTGTGFGFANYNAHEMLAAVRYAEKVFYDDRKAWNEMCVRAHDEDFSWTASAKSYENLYMNLLGVQKEIGTVKPRKYNRKGQKK